MRERNLVIILPFLITTETACSTAYAYSNCFAELLSSYKAVEQLFMVLFSAFVYTLAALLLLRLFVKVIKNVLIRAN